MANRTNHPSRDIAGHVFGRLSVRRQYSRIAVMSGKQTESLWLCDCSCGKEHIVRMKNLLSGRTQSCGCLRDELLQMPRTKRKGMEVDR